MARTSGCLRRRRSTEDAVGSPLFPGERSGFSKVPPPKVQPFSSSCMLSVATMTPKRVNTKLYILICIVRIYIYTQVYCMHSSCVSLNSEETLLTKHDTCCSLRLQTEETIPGTTAIKVRPTLSRLPTVLYIQGSTNTI